MTVKQMMAILANFPDDAEVHLVYPSRDYWNTEIAAKVSDVGEEEVRHSVYHENDVIAEEGDQNDDGSEKRSVVCIRA